ncbi:molecular chaperone [Mycolicibacterium conceptionense]|uniref:Molecular chaperone n=1 Tax=Mycolicibacterium conceptionense TaxID=451644 RepID=A0A0U1DTI1_9MYCO|nr:molecular chaperone [Mycolicibacterium conceptionense]
MLQGAIDRAGLRPGELVAVATTGGGARIPAITTTLSEYLRLPVITAPRGHLHHGGPRGTGACSACRSTRHRPGGRHASGSGPTDRDANRGAARPGSSAGDGEPASRGDADSDDRGAAPDDDRSPADDHTGSDHHEPGADHDARPMESHRAVSDDPRTAVGSGAGRWPHRGLTLAAHRCQGQGSNDAVATQVDLEGVLGERLGIGHRDGCGSVKRVRVGALPDEA